MFEPGDVIFYKTTHDGDGKLEPQFERLLKSRSIGRQFAAMAGLAQTLPYQAADAGYRPWYHVALCVDGGPEPTVIGFDSEIISPSGEVNSLLQRLSLGSGDSDPVRLPASGNESGIGVQVLRPPDDFDTKSCVVLAEKQVADSTPYSVAGLLVFAMSTNVWMMGPSEARDLLFVEALGAETVARELEPKAESCVTAVVQALQAGGIKLDDVALPPAPSTTLTDVNGVPAEFTVMQLALRRLIKGSNDAEGRVDLDLKKLLQGDRSALELLQLYLRYLTAIGETATAFGADHPTNGPYGRTMASNIASVFVDRFGTIGDVDRLITDRPLPDDTPPFAMKVGLTYVYKPELRVPYVVAELEDIETDPEALPDVRLPGRVMLQAFGFGLVDDPVFYLAALADTFRTNFSNRPRAELQELGRKRLGQSISGTNLVVSPAMLWDALTKRGFKLVPVG